MAAAFLTPTPGIASVDLDGPVAVIGDIHGCTDLLVDLLRELGAIPLVVVGDIADHGPDTRGAIDLLIQRGALGVRGNHEEWLATWASGLGFDSFALNPMMGGRATLDSYGVVGTTSREIEAEAWRVPSAHQRWITELPLALDLTIGADRYWVVHAGISPPNGPDEVPPEEIVPRLVRIHGSSLLWSSATPDQVPWCGRRVIMGHGIVPEPVALENVIALDTGAGVLGADGRLTAVVLPETRFVTVGRRRR